MHCNVPNHADGSDYIPAGTLRYIYVVFMLRGYVKIMLGFMLECLVFLTYSFKNISTVLQNRVLDNIWWMDKKDHCQPEESGIVERFKKLQTFAIWSACLANSRQSSSNWSQSSSKVKIDNLCCPRIGPGSSLLAWD